MLVVRVPSMSEKRHAYAVLYWSFRALRYVKTLITATTNGHFYE